MPKSSLNAIVVTALDGRVHAWSPGAEQIFGVSRDMMIGTSIVERLAPESALGFCERLARLEPCALILGASVMAHGSDGRLRELLLDITPVVDESGRVTSALIVGSYHAPGQGGDAALAESDGRGSAIIASAVDAMIVIDEKGAIVTFNPAAERMFGYSATEALGQNVSMLMPSPDRERHDHYIANYLHTGLRRITGIGREVSARRRDGTLFPAHLSVGEVFLDGGRHFTGILTDLSDRVRAESELREQAALARLGEMAAVIAHEVTNPLAAVRGAIQVVGGRLPADSLDIPVMSEVVGRIDALSDLIKDFLLFARTPAPRRGPTDLAAILHRVADAVSADPAMKGLTIGVTGQAPLLQADAELLQIVFQNLALNAAQAMQGCGSVTLTLSDHVTYQQVIVADNGPGLSAEAAAHLFRPFFTTKSRGTGLGLATARRLVGLHNGSLAVASTPGGGTRVTVTLPTQVSPA